MKIPTLNIVGAGKLGKTLARLMQDHHAAAVQTVCNRSLESAEKAVQFIGSGTATHQIRDLKPAAIHFIATEDAHIKAVCEQLALANVFNPGALVFHASGALPASILNSAKTNGCLIASAHPTHSFADPTSSLNTFAGSFCALEGDPEALLLLQPLLEKIGGRCFTLSSQHKMRYHAACVMASNFAVTLLNESILCLNASGVEENHATDIALNLMQNTLHNFAHTRSAKKTLTGPLQRGDIDIIQQHLDALSNTDQHALYQTLAQSTLKLTDLDKDTLEKIKN